MSEHNNEGLIKPDHKTLTYEKYLYVDELLKLQHTLSQPEEHEETLFIIIHQVYELWFKQILHEMTLCCRELKEGHLMRVMHALKRIQTIQKILVQQIDVLETMPPDDFNRFRGHLNPASGFQSAQFREVEFRLGLKDASYLSFHQHHPENQKRLNAALEQPSLYDYFLHMLHDRGYKIPRELLERDVKTAHVPNEALTEVFHEIYRHPYENSEIYVLLESLMDLDENFILWRYRHMAMVERIIGTVRGTGGSSGARYLGTTLRKQAFPEIWDVRNKLGSSGY